MKIVMQRHTLDIQRKKKMQMINASQSHLSQSVHIMRRGWTYARASPVESESAILGQRRSVQSSACPPARRGRRVRCGSRNAAAVLVIIW